MSARASEPAKAIDPVRDAWKRAPLDDVPESEAEKATAAEARAEYDAGIRGGSLASIMQSIEARRRADG
jgi:hypothetical protein